MGRAWRIGLWVWEQGAVGEKKLWLLLKIIGLTKKLFGFFHIPLQKNPNKFFCQHDIPSHRPKLLTGL